MLYYNDSFILIKRVTIRTCKSCNFRTCEILQVTVLSTCTPCTSVEKTYLLCAVFNKEAYLCLRGVFVKQKTYLCVISCKYAWVCSYDVLLVDVLSRNSGLPNCGEGCNLISQSGFHNVDRNKNQKEEEMNTWCQYQPTNVLKRTNAKRDRSKTHWCRCGSVNPRRKASPMVVQYRP